MRRAPLLILVALVSLLSFSCTGQISRDKVLAPSVQSVTPRVLVDVSTDPVAVEFTKHVNAKEWGPALALWPQVKADVLAAIDAKVAAGTIGPNVADSFRERVNRYDADLTKLGGGS